MARSIRDCLAEYPRIMLEAIAEGWNVVLTDEQTPEIVDRLVRELTDPEAVKVMVQRLGDLEREALAFTAVKGQVKAHVMQRRYGAIRHLGPGRLEWENAWRKPSTATERLWFLGLLYRAYEMDEAYHGEVFFVPPEILAVLPPLNASLPMFRAEPVSCPPVIYNDQDALARDAFVILSYLRNNNVRAKQGVLAAHELCNLRPRLTAQDSCRLLFLQHLCTRAGLMHREEGQWKLHIEAASWLQMGSMARQRVLYDTWLESRHWNELCMVPTLRCEDTGWRYDAVLARKNILRYLQQCPVDAWLTMDSFINSIYEIEPDFMRPDGDYNSWYIRDARTGRYLMGSSNWDKVEGALIRYLLEHPLRWLGVVAIGYPRKGEGASCFMLTGQGAALLGLREIKEGPLRPIVVHTNLQVTVPPEASWYDRFLLERFARWVGEQHGIARYVIDSASLRACLESGVTVKQVCAFLQRSTGGRVPERALRTLKLWAKGDKLSS